MDPAALGTLRIGLGAVAAQTDPLPRRRPRRSSRSRRFNARVAFAGLLRRAAEFVEPALLRETAQ